MTTMTNTSTEAGRDGSVCPSTIESFRTSFSSDPAMRVAQNAVTKTDINNIALDREVVTGTDFTFSTLLDEWEVTNQRQSGRCWLFAALNLLRVGAMKKMNLKKFEFSQNYMFFWDKFERSNYFLEQIIDTATAPLEDRTVAFMLGMPLSDGGQWNMFMNLVRRHGVVPQSVMPETYSSSHSRRMNAHLEYTLREGAKTLRGLVAANRGIDEITVAKDEILGNIWRILCIHLGTPPNTFDWQWNDKDREFHRDGEMTPLEFAEKYIDLPVNDFVCLVHDPRASSPLGRTFTVDRLGNVIGGEPVIYLNIDIDLMKAITRSVLESGEPVWFGCDVGPQMQRDMGLWDKDLFRYGDLYGSEFNLDKAARLEYHESLMTHAMLFTGVDVVDGSPRRWRVENSWGEKSSGRKGYYTMNDSWFDEYMFEIAARKSALPTELQAAFDAEPIMLPAWDPMGSLA